MGDIVGMESDRVIRLPEVLHLCGLSRSALYEMISRNEFPCPVRIGARSVGWRHSEIQRWIESRQPATGFLERYANETTE